MFQNYHVNRDLRNSRTRPDYPHITSTGSQVLQLRNYYLIVLVDMAQDIPTKDLNCAFGAKISMIVGKHSTAPAKYPVLHTYQLYAVYMVHTSFLQISTTSACSELYISPIVRYYS